MPSIATDVTVAWFVCRSSYYIRIGNHLTKRNMNDNKRIKGKQIPHVCMYIVSLKRDTTL